MSEKQTIEAGNSLHPPLGSAMAFQTAPYEQLCGCVAALIPSHMQYLWKDGAPNHAATEALIRSAEGNRIVDADCPVCGGFGLLPNDEVSDAKRSLD